MKSLIPEDQVLVPVLKEFLADSTMKDAHPMMTRVLSEITGTNGERW
jgi:hypothetical protein